MWMCETMDKTFLNIITNKVKIDCDVLHMWVEDYHSVQVCATNIIIIYDGKGRKRNVEFKQNISKSNNLSYYRCYDSMF